MSKLCKSKIGLLFCKFLYKYYKHIPVIGGVNVFLPFIDLLFKKKEELLTALHTMDDDDRLSVEAYLESKGAWVTLLGDEKTEEVEEYHLDYIYNTDKHKF